MLRLREKLKYMFLGGLLLFAGFMFGSLNRDTTAQSGYGTIDKLTVRELNVLNRITVRGVNGIPMVVIGSDKDGGLVYVYKPTGKVCAALAVDEKGGVVLAQTDRDERGTLLKINDEAGSVAIYDKEGVPRAILDVLNGNGSVSTKDKYGRVNILD